MTEYKTMIEAAQFHNAQAITFAARNNSDESGYHAGQRNYFCGMLRNMGFKLPAPVYGKPEVLTEALNAIADIAQVAA